MSKFKAIKEFCLENNILYEDTEFPNETEMLLYEWKRPKELVDNPKFITDGISRFDVEQGNLGNCWFISSVVSLTLQPKYLEQVVPKEQYFDENYCGIFYFRFWQFDRWIDVIIDDRLPTKDDNLLFMTSNDPEEFWSALLEKAYAKLYGSYQALDSGNTAEAMTDFTGGITETLTLCTKDADNLFDLIKKAISKTPFISASIKGHPETKRSQGLYAGHAYSVIQLEQLELLSNEKQKLVRLRNPWGCSEWTGDWSDSSSCWDNVSYDEREKLGIIETKDDGEFFMAFDEFLEYFHLMEICFTHPNDMVGIKDNTEICCAWKLQSFHGKWIEGVTAGGCLNNQDEYLLNPKYIIQLDEIINEKENSDISIVVSLTQKNRRSKNKNILTVGFTIHKLPTDILRSSSSSLKLDGNNLFQAEPISSPFINKRQICQRMKLGRGTYCIVPCTYSCNEEGEFLLRIYSESGNDMIEPDETVFDVFVTEQILLKEGSEEMQVAIKEAIELFKKYAGDDNEIEACELRDVLNTVLKEDMATGFSLDICKSMVALRDDDLSGKLEINEFKDLWTDIHASKLIFNKNKTDNYLAAKEISQTLHELGFIVSKRVLNVLVLRYANMKRQMKFDDFLLCVIRLKNMTDIYRQKFSRSQILSLDEWLESTMYL